ncbi:MAG: hypothetical protein IGS03_10830 [Candidatus Sericytochromatia bacterium]|nr:hypothetical protein [Candidatus Sericytochromatia bacterium]
MLDKIGQGVRVQGVFDNTQAGSRYSQYHYLKELGADVVRDGNPRAMHHKVFIVDKKKRSLPALLTSHRPPTAATTKTC